MDYRWLWLKFKQQIIEQTYKAGFRDNAYAVLRQMDALEVEYFCKTKVVRGTNKEVELNGSK